MKNFRNFFWRVGVPVIFAIVILMTFVTCISLYTGVFLKVEVPYDVTQSKDGIFAHKTFCLKVRIRNGGIQIAGRSKVPYSGLSSEPDLYEVSLSFERAMEYPYEKIPREAKHYLDPETGSSSASTYKNQQGYLFQYTDESYAGSFPDGTYFYSGIIGRTVTLPYGLLLILVLPGTVHLMYRRRWLERLRKGLCPNCAYDLSASAGRCPECGHIPATQ